ncbi:sensor histidine kinase [Clostridium formicaceticum]|uniref:histidine kinase n=1 Tax=Clostridium formicaceticum TaxID=1497 RepID=A0AAC9RQM3_9CLOT|nr:sensor histidine kinase [Clostridium formicaceticum]AOY74982.1 histidine kinase [Clostridium formicaceticum]ARE89395.1 Sensor histidine kinase YpdA [Clostridium formicaceticum]
MEITTYDIFRSLLNNLGIIVLIAFLLTKVRHFKSLVADNERIGLRGQLILIIIFGLFGILATYNGFPVKGAIANARVVGVVTGGIIGGPVVGLGAGLIAGIHRYAIDIGGFTAVACGIATIIEGYMGGYIGDYIKKRHKGKNIKPTTAFYIGVVAELTQMVMILLLAKPFHEALELVRMIAIPMTVLNSLGIAVFIMVIQNIYGEKEQIAAQQAQKALIIANKTLPYFRHGLDYESAQWAVKVIHQYNASDAVAITDTEKILGFVGLGEDHHKAGMEIKMFLTKQVIATGNYSIGHTKCEIGCNHESCKLSSAVMVPLKNKDTSIGSLVFFSKSPHGISSIDMELASGLAQLFSTQIELSNIEKQKSDLSKAELRALQAQINPHFLFNAINTIVSFIRTKPDSARELLLHLGDFFRKNLQRTTDLVSLNTEIEHVKSYLAIEKARFGEKLNVEFDIVEGESCFVPPLILQPLVENAIKHGLLPKKSGGNIKISAGKQGKDMLIAIVDNGVGIKYALDKGTKKGCGIGLSNVNERLKNLYGDKYAIDIKTEAGQGTTVLLRIPLAQGGLKNG